MGSGSQSLPPTQPHGLGPGGKEDGDVGPDILGRSGCRSPHGSVITAGRRPGRAALPLPGVGLRPWHLVSTGRVRTECDRSSPRLPTLGHAAGSLSPAGAVAAVLQGGPSAPGHQA